MSSIIIIIIIIFYFIMCLFSIERTIYFVISPKCRKSFFGGYRWFLYLNSIISFSSKRNICICISFKSIIFSYKKGFIKTAFNSIISFFSKRMISSVIIPIFNNCFSSCFFLLLFNLLCKSMYIFLFSA